MSVRADVVAAARVQELSARYAFHLEQWTVGRTPAWARESVDARQVVHEHCSRSPWTRTSLRTRASKRRCGRIRRTLHDKVLASLDNVRRGSASAPPARTGSRLADTAVAADLLERYEAALKRLEPIEREAVIARAELGLPWSDVADILAKPTVAAARLTVSRALIRLAREMSDARR